MIERDQTEPPTSTHDARVHNRRREALPYVPYCPCGWEGRGQAEWRQALNDALDHVERQEDA